MARKRNGGNNGSIMIEKRNNNEIIKSIKQWRERK
jgi:hypothetical protein